MNGNGGTTSSHVNGMTSLSKATTKASSTTTNNTGNKSPAKKGNGTTLG